MKERLVSFFIIMCFFLFAPYLLTLMMNGKPQTTGSRIANLNTGRDVIVHVENGNMLIDVEQYIAGVLPSVVPADSSEEIMEAQAVAVRTKVYFSMGDNTIIDANDLEFNFLSENQIKEKLGEKAYTKNMRKYENAVLNTVGTTM
ncbi:MAG: SpoIID/LytB domain-containing protein [Muribaculaceae bacterium]|nr:SpoIID/LytB domain-containing protein [Muribaculaceae bacterium]MCM1399591.1 SpoIID/LytB domain-containing protein [Clostridium sp.]MCM1460145.1 SpoIID/LytB domain-containing protein [Bacteroides sp.]